MTNNDLFIFDTVLKESDICNYRSLKKSFFADLRGGKKLVLYGLRNTGKTSFIKSLVIPALRKDGLFVIYTDLFGVRTIHQICERFHLSIQQSLLDSFPVRTRLQQVLKSITALRPVIKVDQFEGPALSLDFASSSKIQLSDLFKLIREVQKKIQTVIIFDEFQDVHFVPEAEALLRAELQTLSPKTGLLFMGSKKHMLTKIFAHPQAPLAGMGEDRQMPCINYNEYHQYISDRFKHHKLTITENDSTYLQDKMMRIPESINILCNQIVGLYTGPKKIQRTEIIKAISAVADLKQGRFEEFIANYSPNEQKVISAIAHLEYVIAPSGAEFVAKTGLSQKGVSKIVKKLEDEAVIYNGPKGYFLADPLLMAYLQKYRLMNHHSA